MEGKAKSVKIKWIGKRMRKKSKEKGEL